MASMSEKKVCEFSDVVYIVVCSWLSMSFAVDQHPDQHLDQYVLICLNRVIQECFWFSQSW